MPNAIAAAAISGAAATCGAHGHVDQRMPHVPQKAAAAMSARRNVRGRRGIGRSARARCTGRSGSSCGMVFMTTTQQRQADRDR